MCKALSSKGIDIEFILPYRADHDTSFMTITAALPAGVKDIIKAGIAYDSYKYIKADGTIEWVDIYGQQYAFEKAVEMLVEEKEFDIVHAHDWLTFRAAIRAKERTGRPIVLHVHSVESDRAGGNRGNPLVREIEENAFYMADRIIAVSELTRQSIVRDYGIPADKIEVVHNSLDLGDVVPLEGENAYKYLTTMKAQGWRVVTNIGRLTIQKGLPNLLRAAKEVVERAPKTIFMIVGAGEQLYELIEMAAALGISKNVVFVDFQRGKNWRDAYAVSDLFVMPSVSEPFGLTPLEAAGYGTPSLISKQSGVAEVLRNALKVDFWDVGEMANQITAVVKNDALRDELYKNVAIEYAQLSWEKAADKFMAIYDRHLAGAAA
jgi:glycosyltransferase involved in cell wall biosynthesis